MKVGYKKEKYLVWHIEGGLGKNIASTSLIPDIKLKYPDRKIIVVASYPDVFLNISELDRAYNLSYLQYFYQDYIEEKDTLVFRQEGYFQSNHITKKNHIIQSWCELLGLEYTGQKPIVNFNLIQKRMISSWGDGRPILLIQTNGGPIQDEKYYSWTRDIPPKIAHELVQHFKKDFRIIQICRNDSQRIDGIESYSQRMSNVELITLLASSHKRILIDSCLQHAAAGLGLNSTVLWIGTNQKVFGYDVHDNIEAKPPVTKPKLMNSYLFDYSFEGNPQECPYNSPSEIFDLKDIINSVDNQEIKNFMTLVD
jgi:hypothetical protein